MCKVASLLSPLHESRTLIPFRSDVTQMDSKVVFIFTAFEYGKNNWHYLLSMLLTNFLFLLSPFHFSWRFFFEFFFFLLSFFLSSRIECTWKVSQLIKIWWMQLVKLPSWQNIKKLATKVKTIFRAHPNVWPCKY